MLNSLDTPQVQLLLAHWIAPIDQPPIRNAAVAFADGRILAVGTATELLPKFPDASRIDLGAATLLPGLVNAHVHLELSKFTPGVRPARFVDWLLRVMSQMSSDPAQAAQFAEESAAQGVRQCLRFGATTVGDISRQCPITRPMLKNGPLKVASFGEVLAMF
jgi:cytosine/adenosine deaminase-related metal-dependent hydrolase